MLIIPVKQVFYISPECLGPFNFGLSFTLKPDLCQNSLDAAFYPKIFLSVELFCFDFHHLRFELLFSQFKTLE